MCVTFAALLNVIDHSDPEISGRAVRITDTLLKMLARHTFDGVVLAPMGRVYREVIHPFQQATGGIHSDLGSVSENRSGLPALGKPDPENRCRCFRL